MLVWIILLMVQLARSMENTQGRQQNNGYQYSYFVRDVRTGDYKTQEEMRDGDTVKGSYSVGEPNGDLRVVTYQADKDSGFNAKVQIQPGGVQLINNAYNQQRLINLMKILPRDQKKTGFPQLEIKVVPPLNQYEVTQPTVELDSNAKGLLDHESRPNDQEDSEIPLTTTETILVDNIKENASNDYITEPTSQEGTTIQEETTIKKDLIVQHFPKDRKPTGIIPNEESSKKEESEVLESKQTETQPINYQDHLCRVICNKQKEKVEDEGRAHLKPNEDRVQVEMEQIIRAEMQEPTAINLGIPYEQYQQTEDIGKKHFFVKPLTIDYKPLISQEAIKGHEQIFSSKQPKPLPMSNHNSEPSMQHMVPHPFTQSKVILLPFNINSNDYLTLKTPTQHQAPYHNFPRDGQNGKTLFSTRDQSIYTTTPTPWFNYKMEQARQPDTKMARIYPMYTTGLAFVVMPQMH